MKFPSYFASVNKQYIHKYFNIILSRSRTMLSRNMLITNMITSYLRQYTAGRVPHKPHATYPVLRFSHTAYTDLLQNVGPSCQRSFYIPFACQYAGLTAIGVMLPLIPINKKGIIMSETHRIVRLPLLVSYSHTLSLLEIRQGYDTLEVSAVQSRLSVLNLDTDRIKV